MALGVRSYGSALLTQNIFVTDNLPNTIPAIKSFARKVLEPTFTCKEADCKTTVGRLLQVPEASLEGLIRVDNNQAITEQNIIDWINADVYTTRVRDTSSCLTVGGFCRDCGTGYNARILEYGTPELGKPMTFKSSPRSFQNYIAGTYSGAAMGWLPLSADPLPNDPTDWNTITSHGEMDKLCRLLLPKGMPRDEYDYLFTVTDVLERALLIIGTYGVYGNV